jgi:hypothetical protein
VKMRLFVAIIGLLAFLALAWAGTAKDLTGVWAGQITDPSGNNHDLSFNLKSEGDKITGTITGAPPTGADQPITNGKAEGDRVSLEFNVEAPDGTTIKHTLVGKVSGNQMKGSLESAMGSLPFTVTKK